MDSSTRPLRLLLYDATCRGTPWFPGLTHSWIAGAWLYRLLGRIDRSRGVESWAEGLDWLAGIEADRSVEEIQFWGHGKWGQLRVDGEILEVSAIDTGHRWRPKLEAIRRRLTGPDALWWFRTCETFGCRPGHEFARRWTDFFDCRAAGHTFIIGPWQSGLHHIRPGQSPDWPVDEGLAEGTPDDPQRALWSKPWSPNTITCFHNRHEVLQ